MRLIPVSAKALVAVFGFSCLSASSFAATQKAAEFVLCKNNKTVRTLKVLPATPGTASEDFTVTYSKNGVDEVVGSNRSLAASKSILQSIKGTLQDSKWNCREVSSAVVTSSAEASHQ